jgi:hypothetical protein
LQTLCLRLALTMVLPISVSWGVIIIDLSHHVQLLLWFLSNILSTESYKARLDLFCRQEFIDFWNKFNVI